MHRRLVSFAFLSLATFGLSGCTENIPPKVEVRDVSSGTTFTTYQPWGKVEKGQGYTFTDITSGRRVTLNNYETRQVQSSMTVDSKSPEAIAFKEAKARGGVK